jgi:hypothetical protein
MEYVKEMCGHYEGPNEIVFLDCPIVPPRSMSALNKHINWIHDTVEADIFIICSADDVNHLRRAEFTVKAFEDNNPDYVLCPVEFNNLGKEENQVTAFNHDAGFLTGADIILSKAGGSSAHAWSRDFYEKVGKLEGIILADIYLPYLATQGRGCYWLPYVLHAYVNYADENNTGLGGVIRAAEGNGDLKLKQQLVEAQCYEIQSTYVKTAMKAMELYPDWKESDRIPLFAEISNQSFNWCLARDYLTYNSIPPVAYRC